MVEWLGGPALRLPVRLMRRDRVRAICALNPSNLCYILLCAAAKPGGRGGYRPSSHRARHPGIFKHGGARRGLGDGAEKRGRRPAPPLGPSA